ncbi:MAG TPA: bifunctional tRNA (5-methylaminomethyl-2-thiouridine)(34)-methyltransferase MnmD/FAD-dependent 5-carboxymethylaminomethyl-2-thiouridine(34) oxidoreductase MnmC [Noviherbaspirillum sp.]|uniref:bifunctional tRNA (5-methylaminomethyl-2-thiouridine)(34)-methyltransferase MnmD/FAD-dependent 5-carboxymethylaminomethyl-2-thiouridine(34) oxidoreductase MnmC n=1 Tax=Noviherbaspirillum sp. TaxID=1926288 RepID=UPI002D2FA2E6|nr:bifunctional tRNA (5-methylaminomethyl-2-thiouridine)(34)-methyltransferase MnmD/FAD-dependent 5-carboxymethylaminomethyl-2-thiouridine(34) oxidoreductase MnmC [Noviherbaspirillum sp.]HYD96328.1 bifunctional tRNA (5-methylaminomethyl-2-thiouridine)(34)-methyltransferase MnmD/FAD-dependent 5-carboxymethylaminomethyl-2-thiouridine(34) oxidoreductase MnmC [Noviherbaspirillum sp.]
MTVHRLVPATLSYSGGVPYAEAFGDVYHSADGGLAQARHVFLGGNGLPARWRGRSHFTILETGFGLGLNFLATWQAWRADGDAPARLHYVAVEKHPFAAADLAQLHAQWPELAELSAQLRAAWPPLIAGFHRLMLDGGRVALTLVFGDIAHCLPQIAAAADAFYLDGFAPSKNPEMWAPQVLSRLNRIAAPGATAATYTVSAAVRRVLAEGGFVCEKRPGFGRKRDMLAARFAPRWQVPAPAVPAAAAGRQAIVVGAGIAGSAACERLAARGWHVALLERHDRPAQESSGNRAGIAMPLLSKDDNLPSRLVRTAFLYALRLWDRVGGIGRAFAGEVCGVLQLARDANHARLQRETVQALGFPPDFVRWIDAQSASGLTGNPAASGGWLFPQAGWLTPASLCKALLDACGDRLERRFAQDALTLAQVDGGWEVGDATGAVVARAPVVILANGTQACAFPQTQGLPLAVVRGQVAHVPAQVLPPVPVVLCGEGYLTRAADGICCLGASYDFDGDPQWRQASHDENLARLAQMLPQAVAGVAALPPEGRVGFRCVSPDRLPLVGALPDPAAPVAGSRLRDVPRLPGLYGLLGYASRGMVWAPLAAELLVSMLEGEPLPVERELAEALDPARFALKMHRRGVSAPERHEEDS